MRQGTQEYLSIAEIYVNALERLGIKATIALVDGAQYTERLGQTQFDMVPRAGSVAQSRNEQFLYWSSEVADNDGTRTS